MGESFKQFIDWLSVSIAAVTLLGWLNMLLAVPAAIWTSIRIYEWWKNRRIVS